MEKNGREPKMTILRITLKTHEQSLFCVLRRSLSEANGEQKWAKNEVNLECGAEAFLHRILVDFGTSLGSKSG